MKSLLEIFPRASQSTLNANPHLSKGVIWLSGQGQEAKNDVQGILERKKGIPNKTEAEFGLMLESQKRNGEILRYEFEGITLRWADMKYTPDFVVFQDYNECEFTEDGITSKPFIKLIEVKGGRIWDRDIVRFKGARAYWPEFAFEMHQKTKNGWIRKF